MAELITRGDKIFKVYGEPADRPVRNDLFEDQLRWAAIESRRESAARARAKMRNVSAAIAISTLLIMAAMHFLVGPASAWLRLIHIP